MKLNLTVALLLCSLTFLTAQTEKGTFSVGIELESMNLNFYNTSLGSARDFTIDGNLTGDYFVGDNWSVGLGIGTNHIPRRFINGKLYNYNIFINTTKFFNRGGNWQPFLETNFGYLYSNYGLQEIGGIIGKYTTEELTLDIGGGVQYNANRHVSLFAKINTEWRNEISSSSQFSNGGFWNRETNFHLGLSYNFSQKNKK